MLILLRAKMAFDISFTALQRGSMCDFVVVVVVAVIVVEFKPSRTPWWARSTTSWRRASGPSWGWYGNVSRPPWGYRHTPPGAWGGEPTWWRACKISGAPSYSFPRGPNWERIEWGTVLERELLKLWRLFGCQGNGFSSKQQGKRRS